MDSNRSEVLPLSDANVVTSATDIQRLLTSVHMPSFMILNLNSQRLPVKY